MIEVELFIVKIESIKYALYHAPHEFQKCLVIFNADFEII